MTLKRYAYLIDFIYIIILLSFSLFLISSYFSANLLRTDYPDWLTHAFRVKQLALFGYQPWTHVWANGINFWRSYQVLPHAITLITSEILNVSITRAMVLLIISQFILLRVLIYFVLRKLSISPTAAFLCTLLTFDIPDYWTAVGDYSFVFAVTVFPLSILLWTYFLKNKLQYLYPFLAGISFSLHPLLAIYSFFLFVAGVLSSNKRILTLSTFAQFVIFIIASSLFWTPLIFRQQYSYTNKFFSSMDFFKLHLHPFSYFGLSLYIVFAIVGTLLFLLFVKKRSPFWLRPLFLFASFFMILVVIGTYIQLPQFFTQTQFVRGIIFLGIMFVFCFAPVLEYVLSSKWLIVKIFIAVIFSLVVIESINFTSFYAPPPLTKYDEPVAIFASRHTHFDMTYPRVWSPSLDASSYYAPSNILYASSYNGHLDSNPIPSRLDNLMHFSVIDGKVPTASIDRITTYLKITGTEYLFLDESSPLTNTLLADKSYKDLGRIELPFAIFHAFMVPWQARNAEVINADFQNKLSHMPFSLDMDNKDDQLKLDDYLNSFVQLIYNAKNVPLSLSYPSQTSLRIAIPEDRPSNLVYINESYDTDWKAYFNNQPQKIEPIGPNYMLVSLDTNAPGVLTLESSWPTYFYVSIVLIFSTGIAIVLNNLRNSRKRV